MMTMMAAIMAAGVSAQVYVGGGVGVATASTDNDDTTVFKFVPEVGYTFNDQWAAGIAFGWEGAKDAPKTFSVNPYVRMNLVKAGPVTAFIDGSVGFSHTYNSGFDTDEFNVGIKPGVAVSLGDNFSFVTHIGFIGYDHEKDNNSKAKIDTWGLDLDGRNITFGLYYSF